MSAQRLRGLPPVAGRRVHTLILGSMPGAASLEIQQYYGHPRNAFWSVVEELGISRQLPYRGRCARLKHLGFALWDVIGECERCGSLDQAIRNAVVNDLISFAAEHRGLARVWFNGQTAARYFDRTAESAFRTSYPEIALRTLPSTSPAHTDPGKFATWRSALLVTSIDANGGRTPGRVLARRFSS